VTTITENSSYTLAQFTYDSLGRRTAISRGPSGSLAGTGYSLLTGSAPTPVSLSYDPLGRLQTSTASGATTNFLYDGGMLIAEYNSAGTILNR
jgi:hypothetical protein